MVNIPLSSVIVVAMLTPGALSNLMINNWCGAGVSMVKSKYGNCDHGPDGRCIRDGGVPWYIPPGSGQSILSHAWDGETVSLKLSKDGSPPGVLQFEYSQTFGEWGGIWWDLSDLDGSGNGLVGTPFRNDNVGVTPTGSGSGQGTCVKIRCGAGSVCLDSYQHPDDPNTKYCPLDTGDMWLDLCMPPDLFYQQSLVVLDEKDKKNLTDTKPPPSLEYRVRPGSDHARRGGGHRMYFES
ncbi:uncharacterized protein F5Z01DRAFT_634529 [Emericellopsis atlantica]|uniref:Uncharacterized protein n=1 Tax=Emericellopsis atlantica TaxID=2614577 RepID=A0A9P8CRI3_9HYPO|nr:uncharacterized protein F5Z01DRAFT_634529 [Emericellopsis atlantica]KAG9256200.1 hypothetical protein F5Z01DRAFT_634529 [Emericellopsis atlantica]